MTRIDIETYSSHRCWQSIIEVVGFVVATKQSKRKKREKCIVWALLSSAAHY
jgi:hypothetical protein